MLWADEARLWFFYITFCLLPLLISKIPDSPLLPPPNHSHRSGICNYNHSEPTGSSDRDVVFFYASRSGSGLRLSIKSLRSAGSLCRIILFAPSSFVPSSRDWDFFKEFSVDLVREEIDVGRSSIPHMIRYHYELQWLERHLGLIDRVLHSDAFDVFFQGDPFTSHILRTALTFVVEPHCIRSCGWNLAWIKRCYGEQGMEEMGHKFIICSGSIGGPAEDYTKLLKLMLERPEWTKCWGTSLDQPILNYLVWTGKVREAGIRYRLTGCDDGFFTMQWCVLEANVLRNEENQVVSLEGTVPSYVHQYNRNDKFSKELMKSCEVV
jgi:hypothetical protein